MQKEKVIIAERKYEHITREEIELFEGKGFFNEMLPYLIWLVICATICEIILYFIGG